MPRTWMSSINQSCFLINNSFAFIVSKHVLFRTSVLPTMRPFKRHFEPYKRYFLVLIKSLHVWQTMLYKIAIIQKWCIGDFFKAIWVLMPILTTSLHQVFTNTHPSKFKSKFKQAMKIHCNVFKKIFFLLCFVHPFTPYSGFFIFQNVNINSLYKTHFSV